MDGGALLDAIHAIGEIFVEPRNVDADRTLVHAARAAGAHLGEAGVLEFAGAGFPGAADAAGVGFAAESVAANGLEIRAGVEASAAADAVERFLEDGILAHLHAAVVDEDEMELALLGRLAGQKENGIGERGADEAGVNGESLAGGTGGKNFDKRSHFLARGDNFLDTGYGDVHRREEAGHAD